MGHSRQKCRRVSENFTVILDRLAWMTEPTRSAVSAWIEKANLKAEHYLFPSRLAKSPHVSRRHDELRAAAFGNDAEYVQSATRGLTPNNNKPRQGAP